MTHPTRFMMILILFFLVACGENSVNNDQTDLISTELEELEEVANAEREDVAEQDVQDEQDEIVEQEEVDNVEPVEQEVIVQEETTISIRFVESAPKDRFVFENIGSCQIGESTIEIDLTETAGNLIFDTTETGEGVEVFQPFEVLVGDVTLISSERVQDGDISLTIEIGQLDQGASAGFTIDVDDRLVDSDLGQIRVSQSEMSGGIIRITLGDTSVETVFDDVSRGEVVLPCVGS